MKTEKKLNKHGLPRDIPSDIQKKYVRMMAMDVCYVGKY